jgi:thiosulfate/3-mercaptopyruvate sulfurtransferase
VTDVPDRATTVYPVPTERAELRSKRDEVIAAIGNVQFIDVRSPDEYAGRLLAPAHLPQEQSQRPGHIPTASNVPWSKSANDDGTFKSDAELVDLYTGAGLVEGAPTIAYCRIGERSAHTWFVLHEVLGWEDVKNYDGSWTEYGSLVGVPVQVGDAAGSPAGGAS